MPRYHAETRQQMEHLPIMASSKIVGRSRGKRYRIAKVAEKNAFIVETITPQGLLMFQLAEAVNSMNTSAALLEYFKSDISIRVVQTLESSVRNRHEVLLHERPTVE